MIVPYVLIDAVNGVILQGFDLPLRLSLLTKALLTGWCGVVVLSRTPLATIPLALMAVSVLITPLRNLLAGKTDVLSFDLPVAFRLLTLAVLISFLQSSARRNPERFVRNAERTLVFGFWVVTLSVLSGHLGLGYATYESTGLGSKGFFVAGNELGALYIVLGSFVLFRTWHGRGVIRYAILSTLVLAVGLSVATKTTIMFGVIGGLAIPWLRNPQRIFRPARFAFVMAAVALPVAVGVAARTTIDNAGLAEQIRYVYQSGGLERLLLSGRDVAAEAYFEEVADAHSTLPTLIGYGSVNLDLGTVGSVEMDPVDMLLLFGWPVGIAAVLIGIATVVVPLRYLATRYHAPLIFFVNGLLFLVAFLAGHVWTSSMLGISWALLNGLLLTDGAVRVPMRAPTIRTSGP